MALALLAMLAWGFLLDRAPAPEVSVQDGSQLVKAVK